MLRRRVKDALKRRFPVLVAIRDRIRGQESLPEPPNRTSPFEASASPLPVEAAPEAPAQEPPSNGMTFDAVQAVLDDMVRPAVQSDGGDIILVKIDGNDVYVQMIGACNGCGSAPITLKLGVERLLLEEFPQMGRLVEISGAVV